MREIYVGAENGVKQKPTSRLFDTARCRGYRSQVSDELFPSGPWTGFYSYVPKDKHRMDLQLTFRNGNMSGDGNDDVGRFTIRGRYDVENRECYWTKAYMGAHEVYYQGYREGKGIWGKWEISPYEHGGFHIWPKVPGEGEGQTASTELPAPIEAAAKEEPVAPSANANGKWPKPLTPAPMPSN